MDRTVYRGGPLEATGTGLTAAGIAIAVVVGLIPGIGMAASPWDPAHGLTEVSAGPFRGVAEQQTVHPYASSYGSSPYPQNPAIPVDTQPFDRAWHHRHTFPVFDPDGTRNGTQAWRVVHDTGNCCENYLAATPEGRLLDFGGDTLRFSDDLGQTWQRVEAVPDITVGGEGAVVVAPNGDILGIGWDPYSGDRAWAHKYDAEEDQWYFSPVRVRQPFYDRPYIYVVPGPFDRPGGDPVPYVSVVKATGWMSASLDGLTYVRPSTIHAPVPSEIDPGMVHTSADPIFDWIQPQQEIGPDPAAVTALDRRLGYSPGDEPGTPCPSAQAGQVLGPDLAWSCLPRSLPEGTLMAGSEGNLHSFSVPDETPGDLVYRVSSDEGSSWTKETVPLAASWDSIWAWDVNVNAGSDIAAVTLQVQHKEGEFPVPFVETNAGREAVLVYTFTNVTGDPELTEILQLGHELAHTDARFDFPSLAILPGGRIAASFVAEEHGEPAVAIQVS